MEELVQIDPIPENESFLASETFLEMAKSDTVDVQKDHFIRRGKIEYAGSHLLIDFWGAEKLDDLEWMEKALRECVDVCGATLLHIHLHHFTPNGGISGVAVLAESHISVHSWPERGFAAFDVFMCGEAKPKKAIALLQKAFSPDRMEVNEELRGKRTI